ncbi:hypothetical protein K474DRAFT_123317 [Panus rudis PR-1116 ss-1]|nr:hypothetical protein K474DRAFT_123317 [Panus rudis PR-1116 ss-1]
MEKGTYQLAKLSIRREVQVTLPDAKPGTLPRLRRLVKSNGDTGNVRPLRLLRPLFLRFGNDLTIPCSLVAMNRITDTERGGASVYLYIPDDSSHWHAYIGNLIYPIHFCRSDPSHMNDKMCTRPHPLAFDIIQIRPPEYIFVSSFPLEVTHKRVSTYIPWLPDLSIFCAQELRSSHGRRTKRFEFLPMLVQSKLMKLPRRLRQATMRTTNLKLSLSMPHPSPGVHRLVVANQRRGAYLHAQP